jgi:hypothetical protein
MRVASIDVSAVLTRVRIAVVGSVPAASAAYALFAAESEGAADAWIAFAFFR